MSKRSSVSISHLHLAHEQEQLSKTGTPGFSFHSPEKGCHDQGLGLGSSLVSIAQVDKVLLQLVH